MNRRSRTIRAASVAAVFLTALACEEPTLPERIDDIRYSLLTIEEASVEPEPGTALTRGAELAYEAEVRYQRTAEDVAENPEATIAFYVEMWDSTAQGWSWVGDAAADFQSVSNDQGSVMFSGTTTLPAMGTRCEPFDQVRLFAIMTPATNISHRSGIVYDVTGASTPPTVGTISFGGEVTGVFDASAPCQVYTLTLAAPQMVSIALAGADDPDMDTYLILQSSNGTQIDFNDDTDFGYNSVIERQLPAGTYRILATTYSGEEGAYTLSVDAPGSCAQSSSIVPNTSAAGALTTSDCVRGGSAYFDLWTTTITDSSQVTIDMTSPDFDTYLTLLDAAGNVIAINDDFNGTDARIDTALAAGNYRIVASSYGAGTGSYTLSVDAVPFAPPSITIATARARTAGSQVTVVGVVTAATGVFSPESFYLQDATGGIAVFRGAGSTAGSFAEGDSVRVTGTIGASSQEIVISGAVTVTPLGTSPVPAPVVLTPTQLNSGTRQGELVRVNGGVVDSVVVAGSDRIAYLTQGGQTLRVYVDATTGIPAGQFVVGGTYDVIGVASRIGTPFYLKPRRTADVITVGLPSNPCTTWTAFTAPDTVAGSLQTSDCLSNGYYHDGYELTVTAATTYRIDVTAGFDSYVIITNTTNSAPGTTANWIASDDDDGPGTDAQLTVNLQPGTYVIWVRSFATGVTGAYTLSVLPVDSCSVWPPISQPETVTGTLQTGDCLRSSYLHDGFALTVGTTTTYTFTMTSTAVDPYLLVASASSPDPVSGTILAQDDNSGGGTTALVTITLNPGSYVIWASTSGQNQTGAYTLTVQ